jgi:flagellar hook-associated protein 2
MASITTSGGVLDVNSLVSQLINAEGAQLAAPITRHEVQATTKISALGSLKGALSAFKTALDPLKTLAAFQTRSTTVADTKIFSASSDGTAVAGHYEVEIVALAQAHQIASEPFLQGSASVVGYGDLTISVGAESFQVSIPQDGATLANIRDAINKATGNKSVQATLVNSTGGASLILTSTQSGAAGGIEVAATGGDGGLNALVYDPDAGPNPMSEKREARDGHIRIAGIDVTSKTNTFKDAIDGVTIVAKAESEGETVGLDIALDTNSISARINKFVTEYNTMQGALAKLGSYNAETRSGGPMVGDSLLRSVQDQVRRDLSNPVADVSGSYTTLASIGITTTLTGTLEVNSGKLSAALAADPDAVAKLFGSETGVAARMSTHLEARLSTSGDIETRNSRLTGELKDIAKDKQALQLRLAQMESRYRKQFVALDTLLTRMQSTSNYLTQQLASLPKINNS